MFSLLEFWKLKRKYSSQSTVIRPCHQEKAKALTALALGLLPTPNLMILEPPRIGKTDLGIKAFVPWSMSFFPDSEFILTSYGSDLANTNSVDVRDTLSSEWYRRCVGSDWGANVLMSGERAGGRKDYFHTEEGGSVKAVGAGGGITGFGAGKLRKVFGGAIMIDDPIKANDKDSETVRLSCINWYHETLSSRRNRLEFPSTPIVLIQQRLHKNDLAGHLLQTEREKWTVVQIPALNDEGKSIWPGRIGTKEMEELKESDPEMFWSQYMQNPSEASSVIFKEHWWRYWG